MKPYLFIEGTRLSTHINIINANVTYNRDMVTIDLSDGGGGSGITSIIVNGGTPQTGPAVNLTIPDVPTISLNGILVPPIGNNVNLTPVITNVVAGTGTTVTVTGFVATVNANVVNIVAGTGITVTNTLGVYTIAATGGSSTPIMYEEVVYVSRFSTNYDPVSDGSYQKPFETLQEAVDYCIGNNSPNYKFKVYVMERHTDQNITINNTSYLNIDIEYVCYPDIPLQITFQGSSDINITLRNYYYYTKTGTLMTVSKSGGVVNLECVHCGLGMDTLLASTFPNAAAIHAVYTNCDIDANILDLIDAPSATITFDKCKGNALQIDADLPTLLTLYHTTSRFMMGTNRFSQIRMRAHHSSFETFNNSESTTNLVLELNYATNGYILNSIPIPFRNYGNITLVSGRFWVATSDILNFNPNLATSL